MINSTSTWLVMEIPDDWDNFKKNYTSHSIHQTTKPGFILFP